VIQRRNVGRQRRNSNLHTTIRHILVFLERFSCIIFHKYLIININNTMNYRVEYPSFHPSKKVREEGCKGEPGTVGVSPANKTLFPLPATGGPPGVIQRRSVGRQRRNRLYFMHLHALHGEGYLSFLRALCVLCGKPVFFWLRLCRCVCRLVIYLQVCASPAIPKISSGYFARFVKFIS
jgi:hypothetical protein